MRNRVQMPRQNAMSGSMLMMLSAILICAGSGSAAAGLTERCANAADGFLASLSREQYAVAAWPFDEDKRRKWAYFPNVPQLAVRSEGVKFSALTEHQRVLAHRLIACGLSSQGYQKSAGIIRLDDILAQTDLYRALSGKEDSPVGSQNYWLTIFGQPGSSEPWGWQLEGHHLALNFTAADRAIVFAPAFMGADPAEVPDGPYAGWRLLGAEVDKGLLLINSLTATQRQRAIVADTIPERLFTGPGRTDSLKEYMGIPARELDATQLALLVSLINEYVNNAAEPVAREHLKAITQDLRDRTWFAWMGPTDRQAGIYYRVHSPSVLIEFVTARDRQAEGRPPNPNHVHSMFSYPGNNFGADLLRRHYATSPDHQHD